MNTKIIFNISGGLGNQFFQYAFGRNLAMQRNEELYLYTEAFNQDKRRSFKLDYFNTHYHAASTEDVSHYAKRYLQIHPLLKKWYRLYLPIRYSSYFSDKTEPWFQARLLGAERGYFDGYWSNENYFKNVRDTLLKELKLKPKYTVPNFDHWNRKLNRENSVAIHIRKGDYVSNPTFAKIFGQLPSSYYYQAMEEISKKVAQAVYYIFTDDLHWVKKHFDPPGKSYHLIEDNSLAKDYLEFSLMQNCRHFIIANSTFSWWAAWLGQTAGSIVVAPKRWYNNNNWQHFYELDGFIPANWLKV